MVEKQNGVWVGTCDRCGCTVMSFGFVRLAGMDGEVICLNCYLFMPDEKEEEATVAETDRPAGQG